MHAQIRTIPATSPADLEAFLSVLRDAGVNLEGAGGSNLELGGEFAFAFEHEENDESRYDEAERVLTDNGYHPRRVAVHTCTVPNEPGGLLGCVVEARQANEATGHRIMDISIGVANADGQVRVQIYSELPAEEPSGA